MATNNYLITSIVPLLKMFLEIGINNLYLTSLGDWFLTRNFLETNLLKSCN